MKNEQCGSDILKYFQDELNFQSIHIVALSLYHFLRGITFFGNQVSYNIQERPNPIYHRITSCGPETGDVLNARICYIERKIFDELWKQLNIFNPLLKETVVMQDMLPSNDDSYQHVSQNAGHMYFLETVVKPDALSNIYRNIEVQINQDTLLSIPYSLKITYTFVNGDMIEETYEKQIIPNMQGVGIYKDEIKCYKKEIRNLSGNHKSIKEFEKIQSFELEIPWKPKNTSPYIGGKKK